MPAESTSNVSLWVATAPHRRQRRQMARHLWTRRLGALVLALVAVCLLLVLGQGAVADSPGQAPEGEQLASGWAPSDTPPEISKQGWPTVEILQPSSGDVLIGRVMLQWRAATPAGFGELEVRIDGRRVFQFHEPTSEKALDTSFLDEGAHTLELRLMDSNRRRESAQIDIVVRKPQFALVGVANRLAGPSANGEEVIVEMNTSGEEFEPMADFSAIDSAFDSSRLRWRALDSGKLELRYRLSDSNQRPDGNYWVKLALADKLAKGFRQEKQLLVELKNSPPRFNKGSRPLDIPCAVFRPEALPPSRDVASPLDVQGPRRVKIGQDVQLDLQWHPSADDGRRFLRVSVDGLDGYFALLGSCGASGQLTLKPTQVVSQPLRLAFWTDRGLPVVHELLVVP